MSSPTPPPNAPAAPGPARGWQRWLRRCGAVLWRLGGGTDPARAEAALATLGRNGQQLRLAEQLADLGSFDWNPATGALHWSDQHYALWGLVPGSITPDYALFRRGVHPDDLAGLEARLQAALASGGRYAYEHRVVWPDGTVRHIQAHGEVTLDAQGRACRLIGSVQDITRRHEAEVQMRRAAFIVNAITDPVSVVDGDRVYHLVNDAWVQDTGVAREAILGQPPGDFQRLVQSSDRDRALALCVQQGQRQTVMRHIRLPGGRERWMETTMFPYCEPGGIGQVAVLITRDVSAMLASQRALADSVDNLRLTLNATQDGIFASDAHGVDDPLLFANQRLLEIWQIPPEQAADLTPRQVNAAAQRFFVDPPQELARIRAVIASGAPEQDRLLLNDGRVLLRHCEPTQAAGRQVRVWSFRDITQEDRALQVLRDSDARQRALLDAFPGYLLRLNADLRYTYVNQRLAALSGRLPEDLVGRTVAEVAGPQAIGQLSVQRAQQALGGQPLTYERHYADARPGQPGRQVMMTLAPGTDPATGGPIVFGFGIDITSLKQTEAALIKARDEAEQASLAKTAFLSSMSHELRTPMNAVLGFAQVLAADPALGARQQHQVAQILHGGRHLLALINDLLDLSRIESGRLDLQPQPVALQPLVEACLAMVSHDAQRRQLRVDIAPGLSETVVQADPRRLQQVLLNLLDNAIKYNRAGGWVRVRWAPHGERVRCTVQDSGPGIAVELQPRLFQLFDRLDAARGHIDGSGIGLALCRRLLQGMQGEIGVDSAAGQGSSFWFELAAAAPAPVASPAPVAALPAPAPAAAGGPPARPRRVLCIEDNPVNLMVIEALLEGLADVQVEGVTSPVQGLAQALADPPDLVLLDIQMPDMDGHEVLRRLRAAPATAALPVIAASADATPQAVARGQAAGFDAYLTKPLDQSSLVAAVRQALAGRSAPR